MSLALVLAACAPEEDPDEDPVVEPEEDVEEPEEPDEAVAEPVELSLDIFLYQEPEIWNPFAPFHGPDQQIMDLIFQKLLINNPDFEFEGRLAESWEISEDARTFTFTLHEGLQWTDGEPLTAEDVEWSFTMLADPELAGHAGRWSSVVGQQEYADGDADEIEGFRAEDDRIFVIELVSPNVGFLSTVAAQSTYVMPKHILEDVPKEDLVDHGYWREPVPGYGPFEFVEMGVDQVITLQANPDYHLGAPQIETLRFTPLDTDVATAQLGTGELDIAIISAADVETVQGFDDVHIAGEPGVGFIRMAINLSQERFQDPRIRQAMLYAVNRQGIVDVVLEGFGEVVNVGYHTDWALPDDLDEYPHDPDRARELLEEAGWDPNEPVEIMWIEGTRDRDSAVPIIQDQWADVGINAELRTVEVAEIVEALDTFEFDTVLFGGGDYSVDPHPLFLRFNCDGPWKPDMWCDLPGVQEMVDFWAEADATADPDERAEMYHEISRWINETVPKLWLYNNDTIWAHSDRLKGFRGHGDFTEGFWNAHEWYIEE